MCRKKRNANSEPVKRSPVQSTKWKKKYVLFLWSCLCNSLRGLQMHANDSIFVIIDLGLSKLIKRVTRHAIPKVEFDPVTEMRNSDVYL